MQVNVCVEESSRAARLRCRITDIGSFVRIVLDTRRDVGLLELAIRGVVDGNKSVTWSVKQV